MSDQKGSGLPSSFLHRIPDVVHRVDEESTSFTLQEVSDAVLELINREPVICSIHENTPIPYESLVREEMIKYISHRTSQAKIETRQDKIFRVFHAGRTIIKKEPDTMKVVKEMWQNSSTQEKKVCLDALRAHQNIAHSDSHPHIFVCIYQMGCGVWLGLLWLVGLLWLGLLD
jgi:hypothetical protein